MKETLKKSPAFKKTDISGRYGLNSKTDAELILKLQNQFQAVTVALYELGYIKQCPEWTTYLRFPDYWFKAYRDYLFHLKKWVTLSAPDPSAHPDAESGTRRVHAITSKLSLLKHATQKKGTDSNELDIKHVSDTMLNRLHEYVAYAQILDDDLVARAAHFADLGSGDNDFSTGFKKALPS